MSQLCIFLTDLGWFGLLGDGKSAIGLTIGHTSPDEVRRAILKTHVLNGVTDEIVESNWSPALKKRLEKYTRGIEVDFSDVELQLPKLTAFQRRVVEATRRIGYGQTSTYGQLAEYAGAPRAARAVGSVMAANRFPVIIPCHRVVASNGKLGGFSAPQGVSLKQRMLTMEAETIPETKAQPLTV